MAKIFVLLVLCCLCMGGTAAASQCKVSDLNVTQTAVPAHAVGGYPVYAVVVENRCACSQANVKVKCPGFNSAVPIDPEGLLSPDADGGELCTLNGGRAIRTGAEHAVTFFYAWSSQFSFEPVSSTLACSAAPANAPAPAPL
ncbi:hypothetical protein EJB05_27016 [Eragrostis curvula]|uniref:Uncharacterized protein n=1 Tax=Eragrostis curvula TaxID=38414 RepID=A0A5J9UMT8_9POAL|nr:hypothetical protein EJB05_54320 [Eragrostis curvula]TVU24571.1 hypothetical protein EJB05_27016 [Eragrostis curvula]